MSNIPRSITTVYFPNDTPDECMLYVKELERALEESVKLQSHYANLLNMHDGGQRLDFENSTQWIARLRETMGLVELKK
jgi:hypothetical protein